MWDNYSGPASEEATNSVEFGSESETDVGSSVINVGKEPSQIVNVHKQSRHEEIPTWL